MSNPFVYETAAEWEKYPQNKKKGVATMTKWWLCGVALAITVVSLSVIAGVAATPDSGEVSSATRAAEAAAPAAPFGTFGVYEGKLAFFCGEPTPDTVYEVWVSTLPDTEREKLEAGIPVADRAAYLALLQAYTG